MKLKQDIIVAIDGPSSSGKSSLAKKLAQALSYTYIDTGAMYRAVTLWAIENNCFENNNLIEDKIVQNLKNIQLSFNYDFQQQKSHIFLNTIDVEDKIRQPFVADKVSIIAAVAQIRDYLVEIQQKLGANKRIVMDGRDIGTVVFPNADIKFYITASVQERANRRYKELKEKDPNIDYQQVLENLKQRDFIDTTRQKEPLRMANDAILIDNTNINQYETFILLASLIAHRFGFGVTF